MNKDLISWMMVRASDKFGSKDTFNAACFSGAWKEVTGLQTGLDGRAVRAILHGREDVLTLSGGSHFQRVR